LLNGEYWTLSVMQKHIGVHVWLCAATFIGLDLLPKGGRETTSLRILNVLRSNINYPGLRLFMNENIVPSSHHQKILCRPKIFVVEKLNNYLIYSIFGETIFDSMSRHWKYCVLFTKTYSVHFFLRVPPFCSPCRISAQ
jgi:hypothetical protein